MEGNAISEKILSIIFDIHNLKKFLLNSPIRKLSHLLSHEFEISRARYPSVGPIQQSDSFPLQLLRSSGFGRGNHPT